MAKSTAKRSADSSKRSSATRSGSSSSRRNTSRKNSSGRRSSSGKKSTRSDVVRDNVILIGIVVLCVLLFLALIGLGGIFGRFAGQLLYAGFGILAFAFPFLLAGCAIFVYIRRNDGGKVLIVFMLCLLYLLCCLLAQLLTGSYQEGDGLMPAVSYSMLYHTGGGLIGAASELFLRGLFGLIGTYVIAVAGIILCLVVLTGKSFIDIVGRKSNEAYHSSRDAVGKQKEKWDTRRAERADLKELRRLEREERLSQEAKERRERLEQERQAAQARLESVSMPPTDEPLHEETHSESRRRTDHVVAGVSTDMEIAASSDDSQTTESGGPWSAVQDVPYAPVVEARSSDPQNDVLLPFETSRRSNQADLTDEQHMNDMECAEDPDAADLSPDPSPQNVPDPDGTSYPDPVTASYESDAASSAEKAGECASDDQPLAPAPAASGQEAYLFPPLSLLQKDPGGGASNDRSARQNQKKLQETLSSFGVDVTVTGYEQGPTVTRYELLPAAGVKVSRILALTDDIKLALAAADVRIEAPIPGKSAIGIEVPNRQRVMVRLRDLLETDAFQSHKSKIVFAAGKDISGNVILADIQKMPHLLIAGATGSGKSVCINTIVMSILYHADPTQVKLIMIDPKVVELSVYNGIPHLYTPVVTDPKKAAGALNWAVQEMTRRYQLFSEEHVRDIQSYNEKARRSNASGDVLMEVLPQFVIIVDELADLMMAAPNEVEDSICRLAQLARAAGLHLVIATQRPSVNVITGLIKANMPSRIAFSVSSGVDSRTILDMNGAEKLLGNGDMLYYPQGLSKPVRVQGAFVTDEEVAAVVGFLKENNQDVIYHDEVAEHVPADVNAANPRSPSGKGDRDELYVAAGRFLIESEKGSIGSLQRKFRIGFNRAARIVDQLTEDGVLGKEDGTKAREILMTAEEFEALSAREGWISNEGH